MLLYTRLAPPKVPKRRSRAGCNYCKEKKKKCDEIRPICSRCQDHGQSCVYEPIKPRQRRRQDSFDDSSVNALSSVVLENNSLSRAAQKRMSFEQWEDALLWCSDTYLGNNLTADSRIQHRASSTKYGEDVADEIVTTWAPDTVENDGCLDIAGLNFGAAKGPVRQEQEQDDDDDNDDDDDERDITLINDETSNSTSNDSSLAMVASTSTVPPFPAVELVMPAFAEFSPQTNRRALIDHFANVLSHLIVLREDGGNPFQQLVLPLSQKSPVVLNAVFALASAHMEHRGVRNNEKSIHFHNQAIRGLSTMIAKGCDSRNEMLAAIILLVYYEVLVQTGRSNIVDGHLRGAVAIMYNSQAMSDPTGVFLERAFRFYDVITALSFGSTPILPTPDTGNFAPFPPVDCRGATASTGADALLGMATSLWPIIHRLSTLGDMKHELHLAELRGDASKIAILRTEFATTASAVELALQNWALPNDEGNAASNRMQSIVNSAMAYRHSGFVYLYRTIYGRSRRHAVVQRHTHISLLHCIGTVNNEGPMGALLWPLFVASCEAIDPVDREMSRQSFAAVLQRQGMTNIERARCIVEEVWRRADNGEDVEEEIMHDDERKKDLWRRVSEDMGVSVVFG